VPGINGDNGAVVSAAVSEYLEGVQFDVRGGDGARGRTAVKVDRDRTGATAARGWVVKTIKTEAPVARAATVEPCSSSTTHRSPSLISNTRCWAPQVTAEPPATQAAGATAAKGDAAGAKRR
jgi:hypothetical protein